MRERGKRGPVAEFLRPGPVGAAMARVLSFDCLMPPEIGRKLAISHVEILNGGRKRNLGDWVTLGEVVITFPQYIGELKSRSVGEGSVVALSPFEVAVFLWLLKKERSLEGVRDFFTDNLSRWHSSIQGEPVRENLLAWSGRVLKEERSPFCAEANWAAGLVSLTDFIHQECLRNWPFNAVARFRLENGGEGSWLARSDGKNLTGTSGLFSYRRF